jgi:hypothetical protein
VHCHCNFKEKLTRNTAISSKTHSLCDNGTDCGASLDVAERPRGGACRQIKSWSGWKSSVTAWSHGVWLRGGKQI